jgi:hypothetical protein
VPKSTKGSGNPLIVELLLSTVDVPLATFSMPRVTLNDGTFHRSEISPFSVPASIPAARHAMSASAMLTLNESRGRCSEKRCHRPRMPVQSGKRRRLTVTCDKVGLEVRGQCCEIAVR